MTEQFAAEDRAGITDGSALGSFRKRVVASKLALMAQGLTASNRINEPIIGWSDSISACHSQNESR